MTSPFTFLQNEWPAIYAVAEGAPQGADDAKEARVFREDDLPAPIVFDHARILREYFIFKKTGRRPKP